MRFFEVDTYMGCRGSYEEVPDACGATNTDSHVISKAQVAERAHSKLQGFGTTAVHVGSDHDPTTGAVIEPISLSTTFVQTAVGQPLGPYEYSRLDNPNRRNFEKAIAALEHAKWALAFSSGSATTAVILQSLAIGAHVISVADVYGGTHRYFTKVASAHGIDVTFVSAIEDEIERAIREETKLIWIETPSNPTLTLTDIQYVSTIAHESGITVVVDNTFLSPYIQTPLDHGADVVVHSVTKSINGHSDVVMGAAACNSEEIYRRLSFLQNAIGAVPSPFDCWLAHRGLKTLHLRAREASKNALAVATILQMSTHVVAVRYPGLPSTKREKAIVAKQHRDGMGGCVLSFRVKGGFAAASRFCSETRYFAMAESLGGVESLCEVPSAMTHAGIPQGQREAVGIFDDLVRLSCGIEDVADLTHDVLQALEIACQETKELKRTVGAYAEVNDA